MAENRKKVIMVGKTGNGQSSLGNYLLGMNSFTEESGFNAMTTKCQVAKCRQFEIVDTPGLFDTSQNRNVARQAERILHALNLCPEPHVFLIVIRYSRYTTEEVSALDVLQITFGEQYFDHAIVVVTHVGNDVTDADFRNACRESHQVNELLKRCGRRVFRIDNMKPKEENISILLRCIDQVSNYGKSFFKNDYLSCHEEVLRRHADLDRYDSMLVHEQVEIIAKEIRTVVEREKKEREEKEKEDQRQKEQDSYWDIVTKVLIFGAGATTGGILFSKL